MRLLVSASLLLALAACDAAGLDGIGTDDTGPSDTGEITETPWEEGGDGDDIWDLVNMWEPCTGWEDLDGVAWPVAGATSFFAGDYRVNLESQTVTGKEYWLLVANEHWIATGEGDCMVVWNINGDLGEPECPGCDYSMAIHATMSQSESTCPNGLQDLEAEWDESYDVAEIVDGTTVFRFLESQSEFGRGWWEGNRTSWLTEPACMWF